VNERIEALHRHVNDLGQQHHALDRKFSELNAAMRQQVSRIDTDRGRGDAELRRMIEDRHARAVVIDARGLLPLAFGVLLTGAPHHVAALPWQVAWLVPAGVATVAAALGVKVLRERRARADPSGAVGGA
jgi:hypothetical protein